MLHTWLDSLQKGEEPCRYIILVVYRQFYGRRTYKAHLSRLPALSLLQYYLSECLTSRLLSTVLQRKAIIHACTRTVGKSVRGLGVLASRLSSQLASQLATGIASSQLVASIVTCSTGTVVQYMFEYNVRVSQYNLYCTLPVDLFWVFSTLDLGLMR